MIVYNAMYNTMHVYNLYTVYAGTVGLLTVVISGGLSVLMCSTLFTGKTVGQSKAGRM